MTIAMAQLATNSGEPSHDEIEAGGDRSNPGHRIAFCKLPSVEIARV